MDDLTNAKQLLLDSQQGDSQAMERLSPLIYDELRRLARRYMSQENQRHTLQATALVNEALIRMVEGDLDVQSRKHFYVLAARMMRRVLIDHARGKNRQKRGSGAVALTWVEDSAADGEQDTNIPILQLHEALSELAAHNARMAEGVELVYFGGLSVEDAANVMDVSASTLYQDMRFARAWLKQAID